MRSCGWPAFAQRLERRWRKQTEVLRIRDRFWRYSRRPLKSDPVQGWKIHVSATILSASDIFARVFPVLNAHGALYKVPAKLSFLAHLNSGDAGYSQIGKYITVYARSDNEAEMLARKLHNVTLGCAAPEIPFDVRYRPKSAVYYRYGSFASRREGTISIILDSVGKAHPDKRAPYYAVPNWLKDPINKRPIKPSKSRSPFGLEFLVHKALAQRGKGGVFEALDLSNFPARLVIIKQGRRHGDIDWTGVDGYARIKQEGRTLRILHRAGIPVPNVLREFERNGHCYLVLEKKSGRRLSPSKSKRSAWFAAHILTRLGAVLSQLHALGYVWRDCKPTNILVSGSQLCLIDFEGACRVSKIGIPPWGSIDYLPPCYRNEFAMRRAGTMEDDYALGVIAFQLFSGKSPPDKATTRKKIYDRMGCPATLRARIEALLNIAATP